MKVRLQPLSPLAWILTAMLAANLSLAGGAAFAAPDGLATGSVDTGTIRIETAWARPGLPGGTSAAYFVLANRGSEAVRLVGAHAPVAEETQVHRTVLEERMGPDGEPQQVMRMESAGTLELAPGDELIFRPGGLHVMFLQLTGPLEAGDQIRLTLFFDGHDPIVLDVPVLSPAELGPTMGSGM